MRIYEYANFGNINEKQTAGSDDDVSQYYIPLCHDVRVIMMRVTRTRPCERKTGTQTTRMTAHSRITARIVLDSVLNNNNTFFIKYFSGDSKYFSTAGTLR